MDFIFPLNYQGNWSIKVVDATTCLSFTQGMIVVVAKGKQIVDANNSKLLVWFKRTTSQGTICLCMLLH